MKQRDKASGKAVKARSRKTLTLKRRNPPKVMRRHSSSHADQETMVARLTRELHKALEQQTTTSEVLKLISRSTFDLQSVLESLVEKAVRLCGANRGFIYRQDVDVYRVAASYGHSSEFIEITKRNPIRQDRSSATGRAVLERRVVHIHDILADPDYRWAEDHRGEEEMHRTVLAVPMLRENAIIGVIVIRRTRVQPFTEKQIELVTNFADQAVIAIENVRLFNEVQARTNELTAALEHQTATAEILNVIGRSPTSADPVFKAINESAVRLCGGVFANVRLFDGHELHVAATHNFTPEVLDQFLQSHPKRPDRSDLAGRAILTGVTVHVPDALADPEYNHSMALAGGWRAILCVPMLRDGNPVGVIAVGKSEPIPFSDRQIELLNTFADQAVIAIENVRLFDEVQKRTEDLSESLKQQTATSDVLKVISRSTFDLQTVLETLVESAGRLCQAENVQIWLRDGDVYRLAAHNGFSLEYQEYAKQHPITPGRGTLVARTALEVAPVHIPDVLADAEYNWHEGQKLAGFRALLGVPLLREGNCIGVMAMTRATPQPFTTKQVELVATFADQAVIAIENARLFDEVQARTRELARSVEELQALGEVSQAVNSTLDLETVLTTIVSRAVQLSRTDAGAIYVFDMDRKEFRLHATHGMSETMIAAITDQHIGLGDTNIGVATAQRKPIQVSDIRSEPASPVNDIVLREGYRGILVIPLLRPDHIVGALVVRRKAPGEFPQSTIDLLQTFADQSVVAIQNARLFENVETRTRELAKSLNDLQTAQDRLVQTEKLASLGQLTAGIAHEIKNPLNFVNNFSAISVELIDELREALGGLQLDNKLRAEINEISDMLQGNLDKVVQHGKRADSIVKNMLLHSRQGSGEHRAVDINAVVEESLNLAYHGARAEKQGFNITLQRSLDPTAGEVDLYPQEITRVLLNLISNGFYAATKRKAEASGGNYEPTLAAATKNLGDCVEIRIRDNGIGISPEVKERMFNPFFTTKPVGEGTGLGLSLSHDIIVKQHAGSIEVDTQPGEFTEFTIVLPRAGATIAKSGERP